MEGLQEGRPPAALLLLLLLLLLLTPGRGGKRPASLKTTEPSGVATMSNVHSSTIGVMFSNLPGSERSIRSATIPFPVFSHIRNRPRKAGKRRPR